MTKIKIKCPHGCPWDHQPTHWHYKNMKQHAFPVELTPLKTRHAGKLIDVPDRKAVLRTDTNKALGIVSTKYELLKHADVVNGFRKALKDERYEETIKLAKNGAQLYATYSLPDHTVEIRPNDRVSLQFIVKNSYDGTNALHIMLGAFRLVCTNGMIIGKRFSTFTQKHVGSEAETIDAAKLKDKVETITAQFQKTLPLMQSMAATPVTIDPDELFNHKQLHIPKYLTALAAEEYTRADDQSLWGFYNALTWAITHKMKRESPATEIWYLTLAWKEATKDLK